MPSDLIRARRPTLRLIAHLKSAPASILALLLFFLVFFFPIVLLVVLVLPPVGKACIAQSRADGENAPALHVLHERNFGKTLRHAIIVHQDRSVVTTDLRNRLDEARRQVELAALPIARQVLRALFDRTVVIYHAG